MKRAAKTTVPVPVSTLDADAGAPPMAREAGSAFAWLCQDGRDEEVTLLAMDATKALTDGVHAALGQPDGVAASVLTDIAVWHVVSGLTADAVLNLARSHPELVLEAKRSVEARRKVRPGR